MTACISQIAPPLGLLERLERKAGILMTRIFMFTSCYTVLLVEGQYQLRHMRPIPITIKATARANHQNPAGRINARMMTIPASTT